MSYLKLIKLLYLADREALLRWGRPISTDRYVSMDRGPVLSRVLDLATDGGVPGAPSIWAASITAPGDYEVELKADAGDDELSEAEIEVLDAIFAQHGRKSRWDLVALTHALPRMDRPTLRRDRDRLPRHLKGGRQVRSGDCGDRGRADGIG